MPIDVTQAAAAAATLIIRIPIAIELSHFIALNVPD